jgi:hypothetical protein
VDYVCLRSEAPQTIGTISGSYKTDLATGVAGVMAAVEEKQPRSSVLDMIEDLAIYEKGMSRSVNSWWMSTASTMIFDVYVFIQPKKITPMFNYKLSLVSVYGVPTASSFIFSNLAGYKLSDTAYLFRFYTNDNALINAIKTNGCELILEWEANCIRRI